MARTAYNAKQRTKAVNKFTKQLNFANKCTLNPRSKLSLNLLRKTTRQNTKRENKPIMILARLSFFFNRGLSIKINQNRDLFLKIKNIKTTKQKTIKINNQEILPIYLKTVPFFALSFSNINKPMSRAKRPTEAVSKPL